MKKGDYIAYRNGNRSFHCEFVRYKPNDTVEVYLLKYRTYTVIPREWLLDDIGTKPKESE